MDAVWGTVWPAVPFHLVPLPLFSYTFQLRMAQEKNVLRATEVKVAWTSPASRDSNQGRNHTIIP